MSPVTGNGEVGTDPGSDVGPARRDRFEWAVLAALAGLGFAVLAGLLLRTTVKGGTFTGADGFLVVDALQYVNWLRQAGSSIGAANLYDFAPLIHSFVHPGLFLAGLVERLGVGAPAAYALMKPLGIASLFFGAAALVHRHIAPRGERRFALVLGLFYCAPVSAVAGWMLAPQSEAKFQLDFAGGEVWTGSYLWGYVFTAVAVGLVPLGLILWERQLDGGAGVRIAVGAAACALLASWLQPWQGATLAGVVVATELFRWRSNRPSIGALARRSGPLLVAAAAPLVYYFVLSKVDPAWTLAGTANNERPRWPPWVLLAVLGPLALPAVFAYGRGKAADAGSVALRAWPFVAMAIYFVPAGTFPFHAIQGMQIPLAVLATIGLAARFPTGRFGTLSAVALLAVAVLPGTAYRVGQMRDAVNVGEQAFFLTDDEVAALRWLEDSPLPGGVVTQNHLATVIPAWTGRQTWYGAGSWTPRINSRIKLVVALFDGRLDPATARAVLVRPGAGFVVDDCRAKPGFEASVAGFSTVVWRRGCVTIRRIEGAPPLGAAQPPLPPLGGR